MRIRRKDREAPESPHAAAGPAPYDYDRDAPGAGGTGPTSLDPVKSLIAEPPLDGAAEVAAPVTAEVPAGWGRQLRDSGWDPGALGLGPGHEPGFAVADDLARWPDLARGVNGVFIGLSEHGAVTPRVAALTHPGCHYDGSRAWAGGGRHGRIRTWSGCAGGGSVTETALTPSDGSAQPQVYVQVRQDGGARDTTERILRSLRVT